MDNAAFGKRVERMRTRRRLSLPDLVERTGLSYQSLWRIERGQQGEPGLFTAAKIANALGCSLDYLAGLYVEEDRTVKPARRVRHKAAQSELFPTRSALA
jgi:transcriptional regulator with XRE-family HTH domain